MALLKNGAALAEEWIHIDDEDPLPEGPVTVTLQRWIQDQPAISGRNMPIGVRLAPQDEPADLQDSIDRLSVICLEFPSFTDGRAYSQARLLRERYGYRGELRARGNILRDQFAFLHRCGFDAVETTKESDAAAWRHALSEIDVRYQPAADNRPTAAMYRRGTSSSYPI